MSESLPWALALLLLGIGLRMSAFFSGTETGFYRVSFLRLQLDAQSGDRVAKRLMWFAQNPSYFVATTLIGNNVAHYLITVAMGWLTFLVFHKETDWLEMATTVASTPLVFVAGELLPKSVYYRIPLQRLRSESGWFIGFFRLFFPLVVPLIGLTRLLQRLRGGGEKPADLVLGRTQLVQLLTRGHQAGLLTDVQNRLIHGLMHTVSQGVLQAVTPTPRIFGLPETASLGELLEFARRFALTTVPIRRASSDGEWFGYVRVSDAALARRPLASLVRTLPRIDAAQSKLEALLSLQSSGALLGAVYDGNQLVGIANTHGLAEQLFRPPQPA